MHDRHVHMSQWAMARRRLDLAGAHSAAETAARVAASVAVDDSEVTGFGYRDGLWPDEPSRALLDEVAGETPVVLVSADLHACWLNTAALRRYDALHLTDESGVVREEDCFRLVREIDDVDDALLDRWVTDAARRAATRGVVGIVDYEMRWNRDDWVRRVEHGFDQLRTSFGTYTRHLDRAITDGLRTGDAVEGGRGLVHVGGYKVITDGSLNTRTAWCFEPYAGVIDDDPYGVATVPLDELVPLMQYAVDHGLAPAVHAIGDRAAAAALDAFETIGCRGTIEHAQLLRRTDIARFASLGIVASVQPEHAMDDRDVAELYWHAHTDRAFMLADLAAAGVELALGSDAPVAPLDPWVAISAAVGRARDGREPWHPEQSLDVRAAIAASTNGVGADVVAGGIADLMVVDRDPYAASVDELRTMRVALTLLGGRGTHAAL